MGKQRGLEGSYYIKPTIFGEVYNMKIAKEEILDQFYLLYPIKTLRMLYSLLMTQNMDWAYISGKDKELFQLHCQKTARWPGS